MGGMLIRIAFAIVLVVATWNPSGMSYVHWALTGTGGLDAGKILVGVLLAVGWLMCIRATWVSLGMIGVVIAAVVIAAFVWWLMSIGAVSTDQATLRWIVLIAVGFILGMGMGWSLMRAKATGQVEVD